MADRGGWLCQQSIPSLGGKTAKGLRTTPVIAKTFYYRYPDTVADARQRSRDYFSALFSQTYQLMLEGLVDAEGALMQQSK